MDIPQEDESPVVAVRQEIEKGNFKNSGGGREEKRKKEYTATQHREINGRFLAANTGKRQQSRRAMFFFRYKLKEIQRNRKIKREIKRDM